MDRLIVLFSVFTLSTVAPFLVRDPEASAVDELSPRQVLEAGNERYVRGEPHHLHQGLERRSLVAEGQHPRAVIIGCSDSRVPPEIVFDQGLGDLFVVRSAGGVLGDAATGSIEYAVEHLQAPLVVVLGHERCGAVSAVVESPDLPGHLAAFVPTIAPVLAEARQAGGDVVDRAVRLTARRIADDLRTCPPFLAEAVQAGHLEVVAACYDLDTGAVEWLDAPAAPAPVHGHEPALH
jgi:carbonic anhydrase